MNDRDRAFLARHRRLGAEDVRPARGSANMVEIAGQIAGAPGERAFRLFDGTRTEWVPKSQVVDNGDGTFSMPEWLAKDKGFI